MGNREHSDIMVQVIDFELVLVKHVEKVKEDLPGAKFTAEKCGFVRVGDETYFLTNEGILVTDPVEEIHDDPINVSVLLSLPSDTCPGSNSLSRYHPIRIFAENAPTFPIQEEVPLHDFVRSFGRRLEQNYAGIKSFLEEKMQEV